MKKIIWVYSFISPIVFMITVLILGFITPGYNHIHDTISLLAIKQYSWIQQINFIQLGISLSLSSYILFRTLTRHASKMAFGRIALTCIIFLLIVVIFPTNEINRAHFFNNSFTINGIIHLGTLGLFFLLAPYGVYVLKNVLKEEPKLLKFAEFTGLVGYTLSGLCYIWTFLLFTGLFFSYLGIFQKIIVTIALAWFLKMLLVIRDDYLT